MKLCVIGSPVSHSLSPAIHTEFLRRAGLEGTYTAVEVTGETLPDFVAAAKAGAWDGFNVTMPLKERILPLLDELGTEVTTAVNTVVVRQGRTIGHNTDGIGFLQALPCSPAEKKCLLLGAGGAARAVCDALLGAGAEVTVCSRKSIALPGATVMLWPELNAAGFDLLVNATPLGMAGSPEFPDFSFLNALPAHAVVFDLVYHPEETALLQRAKALGLNAVGGLALLYAQAELSFRYFTEPERP